MEYSASIITTLFIGLILFYIGRWLRLKTNKNFSSLGRRGNVVVLFAVVVNSILISSLGISEWSLLIAMLNMWFILMLFILCFGKKIT